MSDNDHSADEGAPPAPADSRSLVDRLGRGLEMLRGSTIDLENYRPGEHGPLVSFGGLAGYEEVDRYWLNAPFAYASINYDAEVNEYYYHVVEPDLDATQQELLDALFDDVREPLLYERDVSGTPEDVLRRELRDRLEDYGAEVTTAEFYQLFYYLYRRFRGLGKIDPLMYDPSIEDISCDGYGLPLYVYHEDYLDVETNIEYGEEELDSYVIRMAQQAGRHISVGSPIVETTLADGSRAELALGEEVTPRGSGRAPASRPGTPSRHGRARR